MPSLPNSLCERCNSSGALLPSSHALTSHRASMQPALAPKRFLCNFRIRTCTAWRSSDSKLNNSSSPLSPTWFPEKSSINGDAGGPASWSERTTPIFGSSSRAQAHHARRPVSPRFLSAKSTSQPSCLKCMASRNKDLEGADAGALSTAALAGTSSAGGSSRGGGSIWDSGGGPSGEGGTLVGNGLGCGGLEGKLGQTRLKQSKTCLSPPSSSSWQSCRGMCSSPSQAHVGKGAAGGEVAGNRNTTFSSSEASSIGPPPAASAKAVGTTSRAASAWLCEGAPSAARSAAFNGSGRAAWPTASCGSSGCTGGGGSCSNRTQPSQPSKGALSIFGGSAGFSKTAAVSGERGCGGGGGGMPRTLGIQRCVWNQRWTAFHVKRHTTSPSPYFWAIRTQKM
mmetsp:Transcript_50326/g.162926  ORF Transcript_50326/g.162926 Transcript_50326/m.162926 type:complete len:396 (+) Transcript_50326:1360-2547(+)